MDWTEYKTVLNGAEYKVYKATFQTYLQVECITVQINKQKLQYFYYPKKDKYVSSYNSNDLSPSDDIYRVAEAFINTPQTFQTLRTYSNKDTIFFSSHLYTFQATIRSSPFHTYSIKIGGSDFNGCLELFIDSPSHPSGILPKLSQVYSEPECWHNLGRKGNMVDLLKASFQL